MADAAWQYFARMRVLADNVGIFPRYVLHEKSVEPWDRIQAVNIKS